MNTKIPGRFIPFHAIDLFLYPLKTSENFWFSDVFRGYRERPVSWNGLMDLKLLKSKKLQSLIPWSKRTYLQYVRKVLEQTWYLFRCLHNRHYIWFILINLVYIVFKFWRSALSVLQSHFWGSSQQTLEITGRQRGQLPANIIKHGPQLFLIIRIQQLLKFSTPPHGL